MVGGDVGNGHRQATGTLEGSPRPPLPPKAPKEKLASEAARRGGDEAANDCRLFSVGEYSIGLGSSLYDSRCLDEVVKLLVRSIGVVDRDSALRMLPSQLFRLSLPKAARARPSVREVAAVTVSALSRLISVS